MLQVVIGNQHTKGRGPNNKRALPKKKKEGKSAGERGKPAASRRRPVRTASRRRGTAKASARRTSGRAHFSGTGRKSRDSLEESRHSRLERRWLPSSRLLVLSTAWRQPRLTTGLTQRLPGSTSAAVGHRLERRRRDEEFVDRLRLSGSVLVIGLRWRRNGWSSFGQQLGFFGDPAKRLDLTAARSASMYGSGIRHQHCVTTSMCVFGISVLTASMAARASPASAARGLGGLHLEMRVLVGATRFCCIRRKSRDSVEESRHSRLERGVFLAGLASARWPTA